MDAVASVTPRAVCINAERFAKDIELPVPVAVVWMIRGLFVVTVTVSAAATTALIAVCMSAAKSSSVSLQSTIITSVECNGVVVSIDFHVKSFLCRKI